MSDDNSFLYRDHRGGLADSMKTVRQFESRDALISDLQKDLDTYRSGKYNCSKITIEPCGFDERINWDTHIVNLEGFGVFGFTNRNVNE